MFSGRYTGAVIAENGTNLIQTWHFQTNGECGVIQACEIFQGIRIWANDFHMHAMPYERIENYRRIRFNYCFQGRCEVPLLDNRYVYVEKNVLSVDLNQPGDTCYAPLGSYSGVEMEVNLYRMETDPQPLFQSVGIDFMEWEKRLQKTKGTFLGTVSKVWMQKAERLAEHLKQGTGSLEEYRFWTLELVFPLWRGEAGKRLELHYLSKGQRKVAELARERLTKDLKEHITVEQLAKELGVSSTSLKKYFECIYGIPISHYVREKRMEQAALLLKTTQMSIAEVAFEAGYMNQGKFGEVFRKYTGATPLEYRRQKKEG